MNKQKPLRESVRDLLRKNEVARDNIRLCTVKIWHDEMSANYRDEGRFLFDYLEGKYTSGAKIERAWRHVQREDPTLRGKNWQQRQEQGRQVSIERAQERDAELQLKMERASIASDEQPEPTVNPKRKSFIQRLFGR